MEKAKDVNFHHCTNPFKQFGDKCKYGFPRYPLKKTLVVDKHELPNEPGQGNFEDKEKSRKTSQNYKKILFDVEDVLRDKDIINEIMEKYPEKEKLRKNTLRIEQTE